MKARVGFAVTIGACLLLVAVPAAAKWTIAAANISGPGLGEDGLEISGPARDGLWDSGIDVSGGTDDTRPDSVEGLGLNPSDLGGRYVVMYRTEAAGTKEPEIVRQDLYPYAKGGPVTYTPPGQRIAEGLPWGGAISSGWYHGPPRFFRFLVDQGLPRAPAPVPTDSEFAREIVPAKESMPWGWIGTIAGLVAIAVAVRRPRDRDRSHSVP